MTGQTDVEEQFRPSLVLLGYDGVTVVFNPALRASVVELLNYVRSRTTGLSHIKDVEVVGPQQGGFAVEVRTTRTIESMSEERQRELVARFNPRYAALVTATAIVEFNGRNFAGVTVVLEQNKGNLPDLPAGPVDGASRLMRRDATHIAFSMSNPTRSLQQITAVARLVADGLGVRLIGDVTLHDPDPHTQLHRAFDGVGASSKGDSA